MDVTRRAGLVAFPDLESVLDRLLDALALPVASGWEERGQDLRHDLAAGGVQRGRVRCGLAGDLQPGELHRDGEGDPVGIDPGLFCGADLQRAQRLIDGEKGVDLLADQLGRLGAQDESGAAQAVLQLCESVFDLSGRCGALLRRTPLRTGRAALTASGSSRP
ncbi:hypothetical protein [Streptomyces sp. P5_D11]